ncbi:hypothetical protein AMECASPLE_030990, partial [Ameca splendens]
SVLLVRSLRQHEVIWTSPWMKQQTRPQIYDKHGEKRFQRFHRLVSRRRGAALTQPGAAAAWGIPCRGNAHINPLFHVCLQPSMFVAVGGKVSELESPTVVLFDLRWND